MNQISKRNFKRILLVRLASITIESVAFPRACRPPYLLKYAEAILRSKGKYEVKLIDCMIYPQSIACLVSSTLNWKPDILVISGTTIDSLLIQEYPKLIKEKMNPLVIAVGQEVTARPRNYVFPGSGIDLTFPGEAEEELVRVIERLNETDSSDKSIQNYQDKMVEPIIIDDLNRLPFPKYSLEEIRKYKFVYPIARAKKLFWGHILSSRGCPYFCIFCSQMIRESYGTKVRLRSATNIVDEIEYLKKIGANIISFDDDNFTTVKEHVLAICSEIQRRDMRIDWITHARIDNMDDELLKTMKNAGCILIRFGIESGSQRIIDILDKTKYKDWVNLCERIFKKTKEIGIPTAALFQIGCPSETKEEIEQSIKLAKRLKPDIIQVSYFTPYPDSPAYTRFKDRINNSVFPKMYHYDVPPINLSALETNEFKKMFGVFYKRFVFHPSFLVSHIFKYTIFYLWNLDVFFGLLRIHKYFRKVS